MGTLLREKRILVKTLQLTKRRYWRMGLFFISIKPPLLTLMKMETRSSSTDLSYTILEKVTSRKMERKTLKLRMELMMVSLPVDYLTDSSSLYEALLFYFFIFNAIGERVEIYSK